MVRLLLLAVCLAALSGCALLRPAPPPETVTPQARAAWEQRQARLSQVDGFVVQGRVASSAVGFRADLRWRQFADDRFDMRLSGPFGAGAAELSGSADHILVRQGDQPPQLATDPEAWLERALGVRLPVRGLRWWALGLPDPAVPHHLQLDAEGRIQYLAQADWELVYLEYRSQDGIDLPRRIDARSGDTRVIVLADRWEALALPSGDPATESTSQH